MSEKSAINLVFVLHLFLFTAKIVAGIATWSAAVISDWIQSWIDVITTMVVWIATKVNKLPADSSHQFWHTRAQPLAAFFVAIMTAVAWLEIIRYWIEKLINPLEISNISNLVILMFIMLAFSWIISFIMSKIWKKNNNKAMIAMWKETFWDMIISFWAMCWIIWSYYWYLWFDPLMAILIWIYVVSISYTITKENLDLLMWARADDEQILQIHQLIFKKFPIVRAIHDLHSQKLWTKIYVVVHCEIEDENFTFKQVHDIEEAIQLELLKLDFIENTTIHLDYSDDSQIDRITRNNN